MRRGAYFAAASEKSDPCQKCCYAGNHAAAVVVANGPCWICFAALHVPAFCFARRPRQQEAVGCFSQGLEAPVNSQRFPRRSGSTGGFASPFAQSILMASPAPADYALPKMQGMGGCSTLK